jgi:nanoRNase/pAp phosphatase (c-di-AMP/oligoRNAs hydrolase)
MEVYKNTPNGKISLRSNDEFDVSIIAKLWLGGGHKNSSSCNIPLKEFEKLRKGQIHLI